VPRKIRQDGKNSGGWGDGKRFGRSLLGGHRHLVGGFANTGRSVGRGDGRKKWDAFQSLFRRISGDGHVEL